MASVLRGRTISVGLLAFIGALGSLTHATGLSNRAWVSGRGADVPNCGGGRLSMQHLQYVHDRIISFGREIDLLDAASYGPLTITKAVSFVKDQVVTASVSSASDGNAITIAAEPTDAIHLRRLSIDGAGLSANGIQF
jgi:hypothetical protein